MLVEVSGHAPLSKAPSEKKEMASVGERRGKTLVRINSSSVSLLQECLRKSYYILKRELRSQEENPATLFGSAIHKALEVFYLGDPKERKLPANFARQMDLYAKGEEPTSCEDFLVFRAAKAFLEEARPLLSYPDHNKRSVSNGMYILTEYFKTYCDDPYVIYSDDSGPLVERSCAFELYEDSDMIIEYFGTVDAVFEHKERGTILVCDHKTSSVVGQQFYNRLKPNHQYTGYLLAAKECFGLDTDKFLVNCIQVKERPKTSRGAPPHFPRQVTTRTEQDFEEFRKAVVSCAVTLADLWHLEEKEWVLGPVNSCASYTGCQFLKVCSSPKNIRENILTAEFV